MYMNPHSTPLGNLSYYILYVRSLRETPERSVRDNSAALYTELKLRDLFLRRSLCVELPLSE